MFAGKLFAEESLLSFLHLMIFHLFYVPGTVHIVACEAQISFVDPDPADP
jgi:hypothetical protein